MSLILFWAEVKEEEDDDENSIFPALMKMEEQGGGGGGVSFLGANKGVGRGGIEGDLCLLRGDGSR
jgi:hypothetical protein